MRRSLVLFVLLVVLSAAALQTGRRLLFNLVYLLGGTLILSFLWAWTSVRWVTIRRITDARRTQVGRLAEERFIVRNTGWLPKLWLEVRDFSELPGHRASRVISSLPPRRARGWSVKTYCHKRGRFRLGPMRITGGDPFGLFRFSRDLPQTSDLLVYPATFSIPSFTPPIGQLVGGEALRRRTHHVTPNVAGVREYQPGDSFNRIHWPSVARTGRLIVKEFEEDPTAHIWVIPDLHYDTRVYAPDYEEWEQTLPVVLWLDRKREPVPPSTEEYVITIAASLAQHFLSRDRAVGLIAHGSERVILYPDRGYRQLTKVLEHLAVLSAEGRFSLDQVLTLEDMFFNRGTTLLVVTASPYTFWVDALHFLRQRGVRTVAVTVDPSSFDAQYPDNGELVAQLASAGVPAYTVRRGDSLAEALASPGL